MVQVNWTEAAIDDLKDVHGHIAKDSPRYADEVTGRLRDCTLILVQHPRMGKPVPETSNDRVRELVIGKYRVIYWLMQEERIEVITVHHAKRELHAGRLIGRIPPASRRRSGKG